MFIPEIKSKVNEDISILLKLDNHSHHYICECGDASGLTVKDCQNAQAIFISHTHIDHFINFDTILRHQIGIEKRIIICGPEGIIRQVQSKIKGFTWNLIEKGAIIYEVREIVNENLIRRYEIEPPLWEIKPLEPITNGLVFQTERFDVHFTLLDHKIPSVAYLFKEQDSIKIDMSNSEFRGGKWVRELKTAFEQKDETKPILIEDTTYEAKDLFHLLEVKKGHTLGVIMDHAAHESNHQKIKDLFANCDTVLIESFYKAEDQEQAEANYHSYSTQSGNIMKACGVKEAIPVHFSRRYKEEDIQILLAEFEQAFRG
mgnify:CR=1 FL=1